MTNATIKVTHLGEDYAYVNIDIATKKGGYKFYDFEVPLYIGEALAEAGQTEGDEF